MLFIPVWSNSHVSTDSNEKPEQKSTAMMVKPINQGKDLCKGPRLYVHVWIEWLGRGEEIFLELSNTGAPRHCDFEVLMG